MKNKLKNLESQVFELFPSSFLNLMKKSAVLNVNISYHVKKIVHKSTASGQDAA